jgi:hypothetical protein
MNITIQLKDPADLESRVTFTATIGQLRCLNEQLNETPWHGPVADLKDALNKIIP